MKEYRDIDDNQIRVIGENNRKGKKNFKKIVIIVLLAIAFTYAALIFLWKNFIYNYEVQNLLEEDTTNVYYDCRVEFLCDSAETSIPGFIEIRDTVINTIPLRIYIPHNAELTLHIGKMDLNDKSVIYAAQAADIRADNGGIVGAFVLKGEPRAWGLSKDGFCASINGEVVVGVAKNSPYFEMATEEEGYFFRQYPLVHEGRIVENEPKGKSIRRSLCNSNGKVFMVESLERITLHDFSQYLVYLGADEAIYLVGSSAYGWAVDKNNNRHEFGDKSFYTGEKVIPENVSYIVWRRKLG